MFENIDIACVQFTHPLRHLVVNCMCMNEPLSTPSSSHCTWQLHSITTYQQADNAWQSIPVQLLLLDLRAIISQHNICLLTDELFQLLH